MNIPHLYMYVFAYMYKTSVTESQEAYYTREHSHTFCIFTHSSVIHMQLHTIYVHVSIYITCILSWEERYVGECYDVNVTA